MESKNCGLHKDFSKDARSMYLRRGHADRGICSLLSGEKTARISKFRNVNFSPAARLIFRWKSDIPEEPIFC